MLLGGDAAGCDWSLGMDGDAAEQNGLTVEQDLGAADLDGPEADDVGEGIGV